MHLEIRQQLGELRAPWDDLVRAQPLPSPFLSSWWVDHAAGGRPALLCCTDGDRLVGGAAFEIDRFGPRGLRLDRVRFLGQGELAPDHLDVIAADGRRQEVVEAVTRWLRSRPLLIDLDGLAADSSLPGSLGARVIAEQAAPFLTLDGDDWLRQAPGRLRNTVVRARKRLARDGYTARRVPHDDIGRAMATLRRLHGERWSDRSAVGSAWDRLDRVAAAGAGCGGVVVHELADDAGHVIASELELVVGGRVSFYQAGRLTDHDFRGSGSVLRAAIVAWAGETGHHEFDLLRGDEAYKAEWATGTRAVRRARCGTAVYPRGAAVAANTTHRAAPAVRRSLERVVGAERAEQAIGRVVRAIRR